MRSRIRLSIAVFVGSYLFILGTDWTEAQEIERLAAAPKQFIETTQPVLIPASGPERGVNIDEPGQIPPYRAFLGSETGNLSVDWVVPQNFVLGRAADFELVMRNYGPVPVEQIEIVPALPPGFAFVSSTPDPEVGGAQPRYRIPELLPQAEFRLRMRLKPTKVGVSQGRARVTFNTSSSTAFAVVQPMLKIAVEGPDTAIVGSQAIFNVTVSNPGSGQAENVALDVQLPAGIQRTAKGTKYGLGILNAGESRTIRIVGSVMDLGLLRSAFVATADDGLRDEASKDVVGQGAKLAVSIDGPDFRYVARPAAYTLRVKNEGTTAAENAHLRCSVPRPFAFISAENQGSFDAATKNINWFLGRLDVGQEIEVGIRLKSLAPGEFPIVAQAGAERGLNTEAQHITRVAGIAAILLEVVDVEDPIEVGAETMYEILVTNQGTEFARQIRIVAKVPEGLEVIDLTGPSRGQIDGQRVVFGALEKLAPRADAVYRIKVRGVAPDDFRIEVQATADALASPVTELESTKVYQD